MHSGKHDVVLSAAKDLRLISTGTVTQCIILLKAKTERKLRQNTNSSRPT